MLALAGFYAYFSDENRLKRIGTDALERFLGADVSVARAEVGLFELRVLGVRVLLPEDEETPLSEEDRTIFRSPEVRIETNPFALLRGNVDLNRIVAVDAQIMLSETDEGRWNLQSLGMLSRPKQKPRASGDPMRMLRELPTVSLRNARVFFRESGEEVTRVRGSLGLDGTFRPDAEATQTRQRPTYLLTLTTRLYDGTESAAGDPGPTLNGRLSVADESQPLTVDAALNDIEIDRLINLVPREMATWIDEHQLVGEVDVERFRLQFQPGRTERVNDELVRIKSETSFEISLRLTGAKSLILPRHWLPEPELLTRHRVADGLEQFARLGPDRLEPYLTSWADDWRPRPIELEEASGLLSFRTNGFDAENVVGTIEGNTFVINGNATGYDADAGIHLTLRTPEDEPASLPDVARYVASLPQPVREVYQRFRPSGTADLSLSILRMRGQQAVIDGTADIRDASFMLEQLPYRVHDATGTLRIQPDPQLDGQHRLDVIDLVAFGGPDSANARTSITANGVVAPLERAPGFSFRVEADQVKYEPQLLAALPREAREGIALLDPSSHDAAPNLPTLDFVGDLDVRVDRPPGRDKRWTFRADVENAIFSGALSVFPYPLRDAEVDLTVTESGLNLRSSYIRLPQDAYLKAGGDVAWGDDVPGGLTYDLLISGGGVPSDGALLNALTPTVRETIDGLGIDGRADAMVRIAGVADEAPDYTVELDAKGATFWPDGGTFYLSDIEGRIIVKPETIQLNGVSGVRGEGRIGIDGLVNIAEGGQSQLAIDAADVPLDTGLYDLLPLAARDAWDWLRPSGGTGSASGTLDVPTAVLQGERAKDDDVIEFDLVLRPRDVSAQPIDVPYPLTGIRGVIEVTPDLITVTDLTGHHPTRPSTELKITDATGDFTDPAAPAGIWTIAATGYRFPVDDELIAALPEGLATTLQSLLFEGMLSFEVGELVVATREEPAEPDVAISDTIIAMTDAFFDIGIEMSEVNGSLSIDAERYGGRLRSAVGTFDASQFTAMGLVTGEDLEVDLQLAESMEELLIPRILADVADGILEGSARLDFNELDPEAPQRYEARLRGEGLDLVQVVPETEALAAFGGLGDGRISVQMRVGGVVGEPLTRRGRGAFSIVGNRIANLPILVNALRAITLKVPGNLGIRKARSEFHDDGQRLHLDNLAIWTVGDGEPNRDDGATFLGSGQLDLESLMLQVFLRPGPGGWDRLPLVGPFARVARSQVLSIERMIPLGDFESEEADEDPAE